MKYYQYLNNIKNEVISSNKKFRYGNEVKGSEYFDYLFKRELLVLEDMVEEPSGFYYVRNYDNEYLSLAQHYAHVLYKLMLICRGGIRLNNITYMVNIVVKDSKKYGFSNFKYKALVQETKDGVAVIVYSKKDKVMYNYLITDEKSFCTSFAELLGNICGWYMCLGTDWYETYVLRQLEEIYNSKNKDPQNRICSGKGIIADDNCFEKDYLKIMQF